MTTYDNVYCDNEELKEYIMSIHPSSDGLYPHEIRMLEYVSFGTFTTAYQKYSGTWKYGYHVDHPQELLKSLITRGYVRECTDDELFSLIKMNEIRQVLKTRGLKAGRTKDESIQILLDSINTGAEIFNVLRYRYYVLTPIGQTALEHNIEENAYGVAQFIYKPDLSLPKLKETQINIVGNTDTESIYELYIDSETLASDLYLVADSPIKTPAGKEYVFRKPTKLRIIVDNILLFESRKIDRYRILYCTKGILLGYHENMQNMVCECYDIQTGRLYSSGTVSEEILEYTSQTIHSIVVQYLNKGRMDDGFGQQNFEFCYSINNGLADIIINQYIYKYAKVQLLEPFIPGDKTKKYRIIVDKDQKSIQEILVFMFVNGLLDVPSVLSVPVNTLMLSMMARSEDSITQIIYDERFICSHEKHNSIMQVLDYYSGNTDKIIADLRTIYRNSLLYNFDLLKTNVFHCSVTYQDVKGNYKLYHKKFRVLLTLLQKEKILDVRWISEFNLYSLVKESYEDCIYQCKFDWLGLQSLDIYIPELKTAIEYQGEQHYMPISYFGGEEGLKKTQERDVKKKKLCDENNVRLLYWPYTLEINKKNLDVLLHNSN